jgi:hypothetical protein
MRTVPYGGRQDARLEPKYIKFQLPLLTVITWRCTKCQLQPVPIRVMDCFMTEHVYATGLLHSIIRMDCRGSAALIKLLPHLRL